jgi:hypothetical protein
VVNENKAENDECMVLKYQMTDKNLVPFQPHQLKSLHECIMPVATVRCSSPSMNATLFFLIMTKLGSKDSRWWSDLNWMNQRNRL